MQVYLKVKAASLAAEARIIRKQEQRARRFLRKTPGWAEAQGDERIARARAAFWGLREHRHKVVRPEARASHLALGFLRDRPYKAMEAKCYRKPDWKRVQALIERFGEGDKRDLVQRFGAWKDAE